MKRIINIALLLGLMGGLFVSCEDKTDDEVYVQMVSFSAPRNSEGVYDIFLNYSKLAQDTFKLPVIVSGSQSNASNLDVKIGVDNDTLQALNVAQFNDRQDLYYKQLPENFYTLGSSTFTMEKGVSTKSFPIFFNLNGLDLVEKWILPITIQKDPAYTVNTYKGRGHALLRLNLYNDYSGTYSANGMNIYYVGEETGQPAVMDSRKTWVVDENSIFFYAGTTWEEDEHRAQYAVKVLFDEGTTDEKGERSGTLTLTAEDPTNAINLHTTEKCTYTIRQTPDVNQPYLIHYYVTLYLDYYYDDITSDPKNPLHYHAKGSMTMERKINTLIPDKDQAIEW